MGEMGYQVAVVPQSIVTPIPSIGFLSIPAEIRLKIYTIVLTGVSYHILVIKTRSTNKVTSVRCFMPHRIGHSQAPHCSNPYCFDKREAINLSLLRTCRIIYHEASLMHYSGNTFKFSHGPEAYKTFMASRAPVQLRNIQSIEVTSEGPRYGEMKRNDIWHNLCTTIGSMTNLKHLKLALRMDPFEASGVNAWQWVPRPYDPSASPFSFSDDWVTLLLHVRGLETFELTYYGEKGMQGKAKWIDPFIAMLRETILGSKKAES